MANTNIPQLPPAVGVTGADLLVIVQGGVDKKATAAQVANAATGFVPTTRSISTTQGLSGGGSLASDLTLSFTPSTLSAATTQAAADTYVIQQASSGIPRQVTFANSMKAIGVLSASPALNLAADKFVVLRAADGLTYSATASQISIAAGNVPAGGSTGQYLAKASGVDYDTVWSSGVLTVGSTGVNSGTSGRLLYDNAGVLGEYAQVPLAFGGTNASLTANNGGIVYSTASAMAILSGTATAGQIIRSGASSAPSWSTATYPATTTINQILYSSSADVISGLATANGGILNAGGTGIPAITATPVLGVAGATLGTLGLSGNTSGVVTIQPAAAAGTYNFNLPTAVGTAGQALLSGGGGATPMSFGTLGVAAGGTSATSFTAYAVLCGGTTSTSPLQSVASVGTANQILTSNGAGALPTFQSAPAALGAALTRVDDTNVTMTLGGAPTTAVLTATSMTLGWTGQLSIGRGGTGQATAAAAFDALAPTTTRGDLIYRNATTNTRLAASTSGYHLQTNGAGTDPTWAGFLQGGTGAVAQTWQTKARATVSPEDFGAAGDGTTDDTTAFQNMATYVRSLGSAYVRFGSGKSYAVSPSPSTTTNLMDFTGCTGLTVDFNGSRIISAANFVSSTISLRIILLVSTKDVAIFGFSTQQTVSTSPDFTYGMIGVYVGDTNENTLIVNSRMIAGRSFFECYRTSELSLDNRAHGITILNAYTENVAYGLSGQKNGDDLFCRGLKTKNAGRSAFPYNVRGWDIDVESIPGTFTAQDIDITVYALSTESALSNTIEDIKVRYRSLQQADAPDAFVALVCKQETGTTASATMRDIDIHCDITCTSTSTEAPVVKVFKETSTGTADTTTRGYVVDNLLFSGVWANYTGGSINLFEWGTFGTWSGETLRNFIFENLVSTGSGAGAYSISAQSFTSLTFRGLTSQHNLTLTNFGSTNVVLERDVSFPNLSSYSFTYLNSVASLSSTGLVARTANNTAAVRSVAVGTAGISVSNGDGVSGNPTLSLTTSLAVLGGLPALTQGSLIYFDSTTTAALLAKSTSSNQFLRNSGTSNNPQWSAIAASDLSNGTTGAGAVVLAGSNPTFTAGIVTSAASTFNVPSSNIFAFNFNVQTGSNSVGFGFSDNGSGKWAVYKGNDNSLNIYDNTNSANFVTWSQGALSAGVMAVGLTLDASSATSASATFAGGVGVAKKIISASSVSALSATAIPAGGTAGAGYLVSSTSNFGVFFGSGAPSLSAAKGSLYLRSDGSTTNDRMYVNTNGSTTWTAVTTVA